MDWLEGLKNMESQEIPEDAVNTCSYPGDMNAMYGLKGKDHPGGQWIRTDEWIENVRQGVLMKQWKDNPVRRKAQSDRMNSLWETNYEHMAQVARDNGNHGLTGKDSPTIKEREYKGVIYYGWSELMDATGVTKHLYNKYYLNGIDPEPRIGKDGPVVGAKYKK